MTHKPPVPEASTPPWPASPAPHDKSAAPVADEDSARTSRVDRAMVAGIAGLAVGSAAVAAALLFAGRNSKPKSAALTPAPQPASGRPNPANAGEIGVD
jgi:hypothetical protein